MAIILICFFLPFLSFFPPLYTLFLSIYMTHSFEAGLHPNAEKNKIRSVCFRGIGCTKFSHALYFLLLLLLFLFKNAISSFYLLILFRCSHPSRPKQYKNPFKSLDYNKRYIDLAPDTESRLCIIIIIIIYTVQGPVWYLAVLLYPCSLPAGSMD